MVSRGYNGDGDKRNRVLYALAQGRGNGFTRGPRRQISTSVKTYQPEPPPVVRMHFYLY
jgi:hypothetical protein